MSEAPAIVESVRWLAGELSASAGEWRARWRQRADTLREGVAARGYSIRRGGRDGVSAAGLRMLDAQQGAGDGSAGE